MQTDARAETHRPGPPGAPDRPQHPARGRPARQGGIRPTGRFMAVAEPQPPAGGGWAFFRAPQGK
ncbi:hypothetical protein E2C11_20385 [Streptomyces lavendulae]|nr:hypothetical protein E2C11_20385 [Streptomyces lavendulae]